MSKRKQKKKERVTLRQLFDNGRLMLGYIWRYTPSYFAVNAGEAFGRALRTISQILYLQYIFDAVEKGTAFEEILWVSLGFAAYVIAFEFFASWRKNVYCPRANHELHEKIHSELYRHACELDQSRYDDPEFYNDFIWAIRESDRRAIRMFSLLTQIVNCAISSVALLGVLAGTDGIVGLLVLVSFVANFLARMKLKDVFYEQDEALNPISRRMGYINRVFYLPDYAKEVRQGSIGELLKEQYDEALTEHIRVMSRYQPKIFILRLCSSFFTTLLLDAGIVGYLIIRYLTGSGLTLGGFSASVSAMYKLYWQISNIGSYFTEFCEQCLYTEKVKRFISCRPEIVGEETDISALESLRLHNVSFSYPVSKDGEAKTVLKNVSLEIKKGERIAFVGYNGAGKTTLIKLLMRLYDPIEGEILYNGQNIRAFAPDSYREHIGAVFQDYRIFAATVAENVLGGEYDEGKKEQILHALHAASFDEKLETLPDGIFTHLTREFEKSGVGLSGGETQKIAIARVFARPYDLLILDEPSSALDPLSEYSLNQSILEHAAGKTVIFISHRLSTTRMADRIYMFDGGEIAECGSHEELMQQNGKYAEMYRVQARKYRSEAKTLGEIV